MLGKYKNIIIIVVVIAIAAGIYFYRNGAGSEAEGLLEVSGPEQSEILAQEIRKAITQIDSIKLDTSVFGNPILDSLFDGGKDIVEKSYGRQNPFSPLSATEGGVTGNNPSEPSEPGNE